MRTGRWLDRWARVVAVAAALTVSVACAGHSEPQQRCRGAQLIASSCKTLWGVVTEPNTEAATRLAERQVRQSFDMTYRFHDLDDTIPTRDERAAVAAGRVLHIDVDARLFQSPGLRVTWRDVSDGRFDAMLRQQARGIASLGVPVFVTFDHEPDQAQRSTRGQPADFIDAWRHIHRLYRLVGADNVVWVWVVTGFPPRIPAAARMWPGNNYVDWISWEAYNTSGCQKTEPDTATYESFARSALPFYDWLHRHGLANGIDPGKPLMISEAASTRYANPALSAKWYRQISAVLAGHPSIRAITLWDRPGSASCQYRFDDVPVVAKAIDVAMAETDRNGERTGSQR